MARSGQDQVIFFGDFLFPEGDAAAIRTLSLARICRDLGFAVTVVGKGQPRPEDYSEETGQHLIEEIRYTTMNPEPVSAVERLRHPIRRTMQSVAALQGLDLKRTRAVIVNASGSARHVPFLSAFCRRRSIPLIADVCEWYDPRQMNYGRLDPAYAVFYLVFHHVLRRFRHFIVISRLLERHFAGAGRHVIRIPPVLDPSGISCVDRTAANRLVLLYAGQPGRKESLTEILVALASLTPAEAAGVEFRLLGPTKAELRHILGRSARLLDELGDTVRPLGRVPRREVLEALQEAHFTVLLRPDARYANAGFPSKVPESLAAGTPVLFNPTSDLAEYLGDETAAICIRSGSSADVTAAIRRALQLGPLEWRGLRRSARAKAEQHFDYRLYLNGFRTYLEQLG